MRIDFFLYISILGVASGPRSKLPSCKNALKPPPPRWFILLTVLVVPVIVFLFVPSCFILRGNLFYVFPCVILFLCCFFLSF